MASLKQHEIENLLTVLLDVTLWFVSTHYLKGLQFERQWRVDYLCKFLLNLISYRVGTKSRHDWLWWIPLLAFAYKILWRTSLGTIQVISAILRWSKQTLISLEQQIFSRHISVSSHQTKQVVLTYYLKFAISSTVLSNILNPDGIIYLSWSRAAQVSDMRK